MEIRRQRCQACDSLDVRNILVRQAGQPASVYVRCSNCGELVALYKLSDYYHHGKDVESFLRTHGPEVKESGRDVLAEFERTREDAIKGYEKVMAQLNAKEKDV